MRSCHESQWMAWILRLYNRSKDEGKSIAPWAIAKLSLTEMFEKKKKKKTDAKKMLEQCSVSTSGFLQQSVVSTFTALCSVYMGVIAQCVENSRNSSIISLSLKNIRTSEWNSAKYLFVTKLSQISFTVKTHQHKFNLHGISKYYLGNSDQCDAGIFALPRISLKL